jgi:DnaK suppressor protein
MRDLEQARVDALARLAGLRSQYAELVAASEGSNADDEHDPEGPTIAFERQQVRALIDLTRAALAEIEQAAARDDSCGECGRPIGAERLAARPSALRCIACESVRSRRR